MSAPAALVFPFGKHVNVPLSDVPSGYLRWAVSKDVIRSAALRDAVSDELGRRNGAAAGGGRARPVDAAPPPATAPVSAAAEPRSDLLVATMRQIVDIGANVLEMVWGDDDDFDRARSMLETWIDEHATRVGAAGGP